MRKLILSTFVMLLIYSCSSESKILCNYSLSVVERVSEKDKYGPYTDIVLYAFYCDTTNYAVSSYQEAISGKITDIKTKQQINYDILAVKQDTSFVVQNIIAPRITLVLCDTKNKIYAYKQNDILGGLDSIRVKLEIEPYKIETGISVKKNGWVIKR